MPKKIGLREYAKRCIAAREASLFKGLHTSEDAGKRQQMQRKNAARKRIEDMQVLKACIGIDPISAKKTLLH